ncbi:unnamed protein product [Didymodactylos carnosus]|uniref:Uncharacterized protein n=1 Tax=Didymodactylos carnosus TaxID=1234261 RepID=A0A814JPQ8_9BILA|nr:unnamed protein product [Didymodactylos carnosus]CAF1041309.1 unnamed protein product [Didymodactylos carnosus]CAF3672872.1 unnamed protein product [Didymodactylos carnosus]CAF3811510.1 unnamed protein product [Didymodactylos carnosus]
MKQSFETIEEWKIIVRDIFQHDQSLGMELINISNPDWILLGDVYFKLGEYNLALNCYLQVKDKDVCNKTKTKSYKTGKRLRHILSKAENCKDVNFTILYNMIVYKRTKLNQDFLANIMLNLCSVLSLSPIKKQQIDVKSILISTLSMYIEDKNILNNKHIFKLHLLLINQILDDKLLLNGGLHWMNKYKKDDSEVTKLYELNKTNMYDLSSQQINVLIYDSSVEEFTKVINQTFNIEALKHTLHEYIEHERNIDALPIKCRSKLYIIESQISKLVNNILKSLNILHKALLCRTDDIDDIYDIVEYNVIDGIIEYNEIDNINKDEHIDDIIEATQA